MTTAEVAGAVARVYDPELGINIVSLGLVYAINPGECCLGVTITATSPGCPMSDALLGMTEAVLQQSFPGTPIRVELTFSPSWSVEMADRAALEALGLVRR
ncbi:MAG: aromatic ring hydroxylase [Anaerolinea sp.]|nr:aromatic ring hydroxylase [Anaerolinea sp.]